MLKAHDGKDWYEIARRLPLAETCSLTSQDWSTLDDHFTFLASSGKIKLAKITTPPLLP
jgi:hypothetical protein